MNAILFQFPVIHSPLSYDQFTVATKLTGTAAADTVNVTEIEFEDPGRCVSFQCFAVCSNYYKLFTVAGIRHVRHYYLGKLDKTPKYSSD